MRAKKCFRSTLPRLCQEILNVIDMNVRKEKKWNFEHFANRKSTYGALEDLQRGTISIRKSLFVLQFLRK